MRTVTHREMRNNSAEILRAVAEGEDILVTNNGEPAALITQPHLSPLELLKATGQVRLPTKDLSSLRELTPKKATATTKEILDDLRSDR